MVSSLAEKVLVVWKVLSEKSPKDKDLGTFLCCQSTRNTVVGKISIPQSIELLVL